MSAYKDIKGFKVQNFAQDPVPAVAGWTSGGNLGTGRYSRACFGTQNEAVFAGGGPPNGTLTNTEEYDGGSWATGGALSVARRNLAGCGVETAGLASGGKLSVPPNPPTATTDSVEEYGGTSWTSGGNLPQAIRGHFNFGTQTAAVSCGGSVDPPTTSVTTTIEYDGSSWTSGGAMGHGRSDGQACGILTAGLAVGGRDTNPPYPATPAADTVEEYDGSSWTAGGAYPTAMNALGVAGVQTLAIAFGGNTGGNQSAANFYDGSSFTAAPSLGTSRGYVSGCGVQALALAAGGGSGSNATEEFTQNQEPNSFLNIGQTWYNSTEKKFKYTGAGASSWATGGSLNTSRRYLGGLGLQTAGLAFGGYYPGSENNTEEYDGSSWTSTGNLNTARGYVSGFGTQTAGVVAGGYLSPSAPVATNATEHYNGSTWTTVPGTLSVARSSLGAAGVQTAGLAFGGFANPVPEISNSTEEYNGTSWTAGGALNGTRYSIRGSGTQTAALGFGGLNPTTTSLAVTEEYDGSSWSTSGSMTNKRDVHGNSQNGTQTAALAFGGRDTPAPTPGLNKTEAYDGTSWSEQTNMATARGGLAGAGTQGLGLAFGGNNPSPESNATEEYTHLGTATVKTVTTS